MIVALVAAECEENLAIRCLWSALEAAGHTVRQIVFNDEQETERAARELAASDAALAGLSMVFTYRAGQFARLAARARELGFRGHLTAGGHFAAFNAERLLADVPALDSVVLGEGEEILCDLAARLGDLGRVDGLVWRDGTALRRNRPAAKPADLDLRPWPRRKVPPDRYLGLPIVNLLASRGCTHACAFCSIAAWHRLCGGERLRLRSPARVAGEMADLYGRGVRIFNFHDDNFLPPGREAAFARVRALKRELDARGVGRIAFAIKARPDEVDEELFAHLKSIGMFRVFLGIEAGTADSLRRLGQTRDDNVRALDVVHRLDIHCCFNLLLFNPDSTLEDVAGNVAFLAGHPRNPMNFCRTEVYAGTPLEDRLRRAGRLVGDYWGWDYVIADPRAQAAFEIAFAAFRDRNYGEPGLHHQTMDVDYEGQLLGHFFGLDADLRRRAKAHVVEVNRNTGGHLDEIVAFLTDGVPGEATREAFVADLCGRVAADNLRLLAAGQRLVSETRRAASRRASPHGTWARRAAQAAAGLATAALLGSGCKGKPAADAPSGEKDPGFLPGVPEMAPPPSWDAAPPLPPPGEDAGPPPADSRFLPAVPEMAPPPNWDATPPPPPGEDAGASPADAGAAAPSPDAGPQAPPGEADAAPGSPGTEAGAADADARRDRARPYPHPTEYAPYPRTPSSTTPRIPPQSHEVIAVPPDRKK
jgi:hypothetical protein